MKLFPARQTNKHRAVQFDALVRPHIQDLYRTAYKMAGSRTDAEDIVQDVLTRLYTRTPEMALVADLRPWLMRVLYNRFIDHCRKQRRDPLNGGFADGSLSTDRLDQLAASGPEPEQAAQNARQSREILAALDGLDTEKRALIALHLMEGYTLDELTSVFDVPVGTIKSRLHRAKAELKKRLSVEPFVANVRDKDKVY